MNHSDTLQFIERSLHPKMKTDYQQLYLEEELAHITPKILPTSFGDVYSITAGSPGQSLILVVHGPGPANSSARYTYFLEQYLTRINYIQKFYVVAIDCPGYGQSPGSKEAVKTFPLQLFRQILTALGYKKYYAMMGASQGGAAILHAVYEDPTITQYLVMRKPVCGNTQRFQKFALPTLLIYDIEDTGHPIWQGKLLYKYLLNSQLYTFRGSVTPTWIEDNIWDRMLAFFAKSWHRRNRLDESSPHKSSSFEKQISYKYGGSVEKKPYYSVEKLKVNKKVTKQQIAPLTQVDQMSATHSQSMEQKVEQSEFSSKASASSQTESKPQLTGAIEAKVEVEEADQRVTLPLIKLETLEKQSNKEEQSQIDVVQQQQGAINNEEQPPLPQTSKCSVCSKTLYRPSATSCGHTFCLKCILLILTESNQCPLCDSLITQYSENSSLHQQCLAEISQEDAAQREAEYQRVNAMVKSALYVEVGNSSRDLQTKQSMFTRTKKKYIWQVYVRAPKGIQLQEVAFNINRRNRQAKPICLRSAPFAYESRGTFSFTCEVTIKPKNREYASVTISYRIDVDPGSHSKSVALFKKCYQS